MIQNDLELLMDSLPNRARVTLTKVTTNLPDREKERMFLYLLGLEHNERLATLTLYGSVTTSRQRKTLRDMMSRQITDPLTGLYNRFHFDKDLELTLWEVDREQRRISEKQRVQDPLVEKSLDVPTQRNSLYPDASLLFLDIDHFKRVNDTYGHTVGDNALKDVAYWIRHSLRRGDTRVSRLGGEEIGIILKQTDENQGRMVAERIRANIQENLLNYFATTAVITKQDYDPPQGITVSIGVANYRRTCKKPEVPLFKRQADVALYAAKNNGRNCVVVYSAQLDHIFRNT